MKLSEAMAKINELENEVKVLTENVEKQKKNYDLYYNYYNETKSELLRSHDILDLLEVPKKNKREYGTVDIELTNRILLFITRKRRKFQSNCFFTN